MPWKNPADKKRYDKKRYDRKRADKVAVLVQEQLVSPELPANPGQAIQDWCRDRLRVPWGHPNEGKPLALPDYGQRFIQDIFDPQFTEVSMLISRKSAKTTICAVSGLGLALR